MPRFRPPHVSQEDGSVCEWEHCWAAVGAWAAIGSSGGARTPEPTAFCHFARKDPCENGGLSDMVRGLLNMGLYDRAKYTPDIAKADLRQRLLRRDGALVALEIDNDSWPGTHSTAYHSVGVVCGGGTYKNKGKVLTMDPAEHAYRWRDVDDVIAAAAEYNREHHETPNTIDVLVILPPKE